MLEDPPLRAWTSGTLHPSQYLMRAVDTPSSRCNPGEREELRPWLARLAPGFDRGDGAAALELLWGRVDPPLVARGPGCEALFDGVLHNIEELRAALPDSQPPLGGTADVVLYSYLRWGTEALAKLKGIFALTIWDRRRRSLLCARDPLGFYPLFYASLDTGLFFSTSIDALLSDPRVPGTLNRPALAGSLIQSWPDPQETYFTAIRRLPPGHAMLVDHRGRRTYRYWDPAPEGQDVEWITEEELERFDDLLTQAVERFLLLGRAGVFLSGGLDSVSVAAVATDSSRARGLKDPYALSLAFPDPEANEEPVQRAVANGLGIPQVMLGMDEAVDGQSLLLAALEASSRRSSPLVNYWSPAYERLADEGQRGGCETILTGSGGDEWLVVGPLLAADLLKAGDLAGLRRLAASHRRSFRPSAAQVWRNLLWTFGAKVLFKAAVREMLSATFPWALRAYRRRAHRRRMMDWVAPEAELRQELERRAEAEIRMPPYSFYQREGRKALDHPMVSLDMEETFESGKIVGTRIAAPFLDADLVDFLYRTPPDFLNQGGREKGLVRGTLDRRFPALGFEQSKKVGATAYSRSLMSSHGKQAWRALGGIPALTELGLVDPRVFEVSFERIVAGQDPEFWHVWDTLSMETWLRPRISGAMSESDISWWEK
jgi:asparagine synthase (glutamine-hydrolysing)